MQKTKLWRVVDTGDGCAGIVEVVESAGVETERLLENPVVSDPSIVMPGLVLIGRQTPADGGFLDLLGVDEAGGLVVFELKRGHLTREAVAQVVDYASVLAGMSTEGLSRHVEDASGNEGIEKINNFVQWYGERFAGDQPDLQEDIRMVLVGVGTDEKALRMTQFLADRGVDISLITFEAFDDEGHQFLARRAEVLQRSGSRMTDRT